jgi:hypothetical protein
LNRSLSIAVLLVTLVAVACGSGDKRAAEPTKQPAAPSEASEPRATATTKAEEPTKEAAGEGSGDALSSLFGSVFQGGLSGSGSASGLGTGDESLKAFLPSEADFPDGYFNLGSFTFSAPGDTALGATDMAMTMAMKGDPSALAGAGAGDVDFSQIEMLMAMVMRPDDLRALGGAFDDIKNMDPEDIEDEINSSIGEMEGFELQRFAVLDAAGLGEGGFGLEMTIDMTALSGIFGQLGGPDAPKLEAMSMRMYLFGRGDYVGAVMRIGFADSLGGGGEDLDMAHVIDGKLAGS